MCPASAKVVDVLAVRLVKQGTETTGFRTGSSLHLCQHVYMQASMIIYYSIRHEILHKYVGLTFVLVQS